MSGEIPQDAKDCPLIEHEPGGDLSGIAGPFAKNVCDSEPGRCANCEMGDKAIRQAQ
jgi:hypothetical protein